MNHLADLVYRVPKKSTDVIKELANACSLSESWVRVTINDPKRDMMASAAVKAVRYFNTYFPCNIEDLIEIDIVRLAKRAKLVKPKSESDFGHAHGRARTSRQATPN